MTVRFDPAQGPIRLAGEASGPAGAAIVRLLLDTGATTSIISREVLGRLGYEVDSAADRVEVAMGGGTAVAPRVVVNRFSAAGVDRFGLTVLALDLPDAAGAEGLLGLDFLRGRVVTLDLVAGVLDLG